MYFISDVERHCISKRGLNSINSNKSFPISSPKPSCDMRFYRSVTALRFQSDYIGWLKQAFSAFTACCCIFKVIVSIWTNFENATACSNAHWKRSSQRASSSAWEEVIHFPLIRSQFKILDMFCSSHTFHKYKYLFWHVCNWFLFSANSGS